MSTTPSERTQQRRRLLKAAAAAPAIFTLNVGTAHAFSSTQCIDRGQALHPAPPDPTPAPDSWVRKRVTTVDPGTGATVVTYQIADGGGQGPVYGGTCWNSFYQVTPGASGSADGNNVLIP